jgi:HEAT repeat protein
MAAKAIEPVVAVKRPADTNRMLLIWETAQEVVRSAAEAGGYLVRMLVLAGQPTEASAFVATARDDGIRDRWTDAQADALAETGDPAAALPLANGLADPVLRARALAAVGAALKS